MTDPLWDVLGITGGESRPFCSSFNPFLHYQEALIFPEAWDLMGLDRGGIWDATKQLSLLQLAFNPAKTNGAPLRVPETNYNWDKKIWILIKRLFLMYKQLSNI